MKILAVSDEVSLSLETLIATDPGRFKDVNVIVSCGDLDTEYLEYIVDGINREFCFVKGNHSHEISGRNCGHVKTERFAGVPQCVAGVQELHGRVVALKNYLFAGFGGSMWYNGEVNQFTERQMAQVIKKVERGIAWHRLQDKFMRRPPKDVIIISHAPVADIHDLPDRAHKGFKCFKAFIDRVAPLLWLHGHIHLPNQHTNQLTVSGTTTIANVFGCKVIEINRRDIKVLSHCNCCS